MKPNGVVIWESPTVVSIATNLVRKSKNGKVGADVVQVWILAKAENPYDAQRSGHDRHVCGDCPFGQNRGCYVNTARAPKAIWKAWMRGAYPRMRRDEIWKYFGGRFVRLGAYGDPALLPIDLIRGICLASSGWTGYTHQWRDYFRTAYQRYLMASCDASDYAEAQSYGWRTFTVSRTQLTGQMTCPASAEFAAQRGWKLTCAECKLCSGKSGRGEKARSVQIAPHGARKAQIA